MKILLILDEMWNDDTSPNNNMTNWFLNFDGVEFAAICCSAGLPKTDCCSIFFQITDSMMIKSLFSSYKAGRILREDNVIKNNFYGKKKKWYSNDLFRIARSIIWRIGKYDLLELKKFIDCFNPDIIFSQRRGSIKISRLECIISTLSDKPIIAYTGDDEFQSRHGFMNPLAFIHLLWTRRWLKKAYKKYRLIYCSSQSQVEEFSRRFHLNSKFLVKAGEFHKEVKIPQKCGIKIMYAGKLYCNRFKTLGLIGQALSIVNCEDSPNNIYLDIYAPEGNEKKYKRYFSKYKYVKLYEKISPEELSLIRNNYNLLAHVEGLDKNNSTLTRYSFSTKLMDCISSGIATIVISRSYHSGYEYCKKHNIAFVATNLEELSAILSQIKNNPNILKNKAENAIAFGFLYHDRKLIQKRFLEDFRVVIKKEKEKNENTSC